MGDLWLIVGIMIMNGEINGYQSSSNLNTEFTNLSYSIGSNIQKIIQNVAAIKKMCNHVGTNENDRQIREQLHEAQHNTEKLVNKTSNELNNLNVIANTRPDGGTALPSEVLLGCQLQKDR